MADHDPEPKDSWLKAWWPVVVVGIGGMAAVVGYLVNFGVETSGDQDTWGQFGDYLGGILNPLVAAFALVMLIISVGVQRKELRDTRKELAAARFESHFFNTVTLLAQEVPRLRESNAMVEFHQALTSDQVHTAAEFVGRCASTVDRYSMHCSPTVSLIKVAAGTLSRHSGSLKPLEIFDYARTLRGFVGEFEFCALVGTIEKDDDTSLSDYVEQFRLLENVPSGARGRAWNLPGRGDTLLNALAHIQPPAG